MSAFPTLAYNPELSSDEEVLDDLQVFRASNGKARVHAFFTAPKKRFSIVWDSLTATDKGTIQTFYAANRLLTFTFTWVGDGVTYTCIFSGAPKYQVVAGGRWTVTVKMEEA